jgi:hypothetical protein
MNYRVALELATGPSRYGRGTPHMGQMPPSITPIVYYLYRHRVLWSVFDGNSQDPSGPFGTLRDPSGRKSVKTIRPMRGSRTPAGSRRIRRDYRRKAEGSH